MTDKEFHRDAYPLRDKTRALGPPVPDHILKATGELKPSVLFPEFDPRIEQWDAYSELLKDREDRGIYHLKSFCPSTVTPCSTEHRDWFVKVPEGKYFSMSARSYGAQHFVNNPQGYQEFVARNKKFGVERSGFFLESIERAVANMDRHYANQYNTSYYFHVRCKSCNREEIGCLVTSHHCHATEGGSTTLGQNSWLKPLYFAHNIFDLLPDQDHDHVQAAGGWKVKKASEIVQNCPWIPDRIKDKSPPDNDFIYCKDATNPDFLVVMALDRYLETHVKCSFVVDRDSHPYDTNWVNSFSIVFLLGYVQDNRRSRRPIIAAECYDSTRYHYLRPAFPNTGPNGELLQPKHKCFQSEKSGKAARFRPDYMTSILDFPLEYARRYWVLAGKSDKEGGANDGKKALLDWEVSDADMTTFKNGLGRKIEALNP